MSNQSSKTSTESSKKPWSAPTVKTLPVEETRGGGVFGPGGDDGFYFS